MADRTKLAFVEALKELLKTKSLQKVTIQELADACGYNRMTFYYHFQDIYALLEWACREEAQRAIADKRTYETWQEGFCQLLEAIEEEKHVILQVDRALGRGQIESYLYGLTEPLLAKVIEEMPHHQGIGKEDEDFLASFYTYAFVGVVMEWMQKDCEPSPKEVTEKVAWALKGCFREALSRPHDTSRTM